MRFSTKKVDTTIIKKIKKNEKLAKVGALIALLLVLLTCWQVGVRYDSTKANTYKLPESREEFETNFSYLVPTEVDVKTTSDKMTKVDLSEFEDEFVITQGGDYRLTGVLKGTVRIDAKDENVHLFLDNATISAKEGPAVLAENANKVIFTLLPDTTNEISDSGDYRNSDGYEAAIHAECDLTFNGTGSLKVSGLYEDAIRSKDRVKILDGDYNIRCKRTAVRGNDGINVSGGNLFISSEKYGFKTTKLGADGRGNIMISGCTIAMIAGRYSFVTEKANLYIYDCDVKMRSVVSHYDVGGLYFVERGCTNE